MASNSKEEDHVREAQPGGRGAVSAASSRQARRAARKLEAQTRSDVLSEPGSADVVVKAPQE